ncbi:hypothetical protein Gbro_4716 [Gordonia bronchialis DSM 43247]|uniref:ORC1/DEAH AAA+ ATPase domain-containing protein n=1 Tax=Gordonia bronchialis (strain ATCC 25592 / DSM 43247 / BCRC 13721 / JCM 3198 / KCTC 3076 / NBRC 16047 / NCTC 10667) TaxID=526226 RepID=D0L889_GORB4|nr:AAA family ATPase [Gordonia bronchialis]ACY23837.1 hypothetical protein Gbro_4716 [Gordonia bronchialis DSM 43247]MCC3322001.1 TniB family NTP-binding protein [Gordonia bronchialis]QGS22857.1 AAA family ATPase [Gordonia bronchialis]STQ66860.1 Uncharacterised protein [Gordonia bronchialis]
MIHTGRWDLTRREGWRAFVTSERRARPDVLTVRELNRLTHEAREDYDDRRLDFHANFGVIRTPQLVQAHALMTMVLDTGLRVDSDRVKPSVVIDADAGVGKTTTVNEYLREFERRELRKYGERTDRGHDRIPVCRVGMSAKAGLKPVVATLLRFYGGAQVDTDSLRRNELYEMLIDYVDRTDTRIIAVDDMHFVDPTSRDGLAVSNFIKGVSNDLGVALVITGVDLASRGLYTDGKAFNTTSSQNGRRWTPVNLAAYTNKGREGKRAWKDLLAAYEQQLVLAAHEPTDLVSHAQLIHDRTQGYLVSLNHLITRAASYAIATKSERITEEILRLVPLDYIAQSYWENTAGKNIAA